MVQELICQVQNLVLQQLGAAQVAIMKILLEQFADEVTETKLGTWIQRAVKSQAVDVGHRLDLMPRITSDPTMDHTTGLLDQQ